MVEYRRSAMIISASYKTDIPAFYGDWFINRLRLGHCRMRNPWGGQLYDVPLDPESVDGFVFWTRNIGPFLHQLDEVHRGGYPFVVQYTITGYPRELERSVQDGPRMMRLARRVADEFGPHAVVWRYDPILYSSLTSREFHLDNFADIARGMDGVTTEVVISYTHFYRKTRRNLDRAAERSGFTWNDEIPQLKRGLTSDLAAIARTHGMHLTVCSQQAFMSGRVQPARCVDAKRLSRVAGYDITAREKGNRPGCGCHESRDIGEYDTCPHGCVYCYAVDQRSRAQVRYRTHDPSGPFLFAPEDVPKHRRKTPAAGSSFDNKFG